MRMTVPEIPTPPVPAGIRLLAVRADAWRVIDARGRALGQLAASSTPAGIRFHARRFALDVRAFRDIGAFWSAADAVECLRLSV